MDGEKLRKLAPLGTILSFIFTFIIFNFDFITGEVINTSINLKVMDIDYNMYDVIFATRDSFAYNSTALPFFIIFIIEMVIFFTLCVLNYIDKHNKTFIALTVIGITISFINCCMLLPVTYFSEYDVMRYFYDQGYRNYDFEGGTNEIILLIFFLYSFAIIIGFVTFAIILYYLKSKSDLKNIENSEKMYKAWGAINVAFAFIPLIFIGIIFLLFSRSGFSNRRTANSDYRPINYKLDKENGILVFEKKQYQIKDNVLYNKQNVAVGRLEKDKPVFNKGVKL